MSYRVGDQVEPPTGCVVINDKRCEWVKTKVLRIIRIGGTRNRVYNVDSDRCIHDSSVKLSRRMLTRARRDNRLWGDGCHSPVSFTERHVVSAVTYEHLRSWIFSTDFLEPLKATEQSTKRGHCFAVKEALAQTWERYKVSAKKKGVEHVSERVYRRILGQKIFTKHKKDHCMCATCLRSGWRGIWDACRNLLKKIDACTIWEVTTNEDGKQTRHAPGTHLHPRLKRLWDYLRLQLHLHVETTSTIGAHCSNLKLGSLAEPRFNNTCSNHDDNLGPAPPNEPAKSRECCGDECAKRSTYHCKHCTTSFCKDHLVDNICKAEELPAGFKNDFVCCACSPNVEAQRHKQEGCASCDEVEYFKRDLMKVAKATDNADIVGRAQNVCKCIDDMVGHVTRTANQVLKTLP